MANVLNPISSSMPEEKEEKFIPFRERGLLNLKDPKITKDFLKRHCRENKLYVTPELNDVLYLHFKGFSKIECLEEYVGLKSLWLESNGIKQISNLDNQLELRCLYLHYNLLHKIENISHLVHLDTLTLDHNGISKIENLSDLPVLKTLQISHNRVSSVDDLIELIKCPQLSSVDLSHNFIEDHDVLPYVFAHMKSLSLINLMNNKIKMTMPNYRRRMICDIPNLHYLDDRPVFKQDRIGAEAWLVGGLEAERKARHKLREEDDKRIRDSCLRLAGYIKKNIQKRTESESSDNEEKEKEPKEEPKRIDIVEVIDEKEKSDKEELEKEEDGKENELEKSEENNGNLIQNTRCEASNEEGNREEIDQQNNMNEPLIVDDIKIDIDEVLANQSTNEDKNEQDYYFINDDDIKKATGEIIDDMESIINQLKDGQILDMSKEMVDEKLDKKEKIVDIQLNEQEVELNESSINEMDHSIKNEELNEEKIDDALLHFDSKFEEIEEDENGDFEKMKDLLFEYETKNDDGTRILKIDEGFDDEDKEEKLPNLNEEINNETNFENNNSKDEKEEIIELNFKKNKTNETEVKLDEKKMEFECQKIEEELIHIFNDTPGHDDDDGERVSTSEFIKFTDISKSSKNEAKDQNDFFIKEISTKRYGKDTK
ncbi:hypothetical protein SNEBB_005810 [Seison nebaliae]|nr:hypothetical protein SNEBB_005810 [Seison nebaliae]